MGYENKLPLHKRIENILPIDRWVDLGEICDMTGSTAKSYVKMTLFAMPNVAWKRVTHYESPIKSEGVKWKWQFRRIES